MRPAVSHDAVTILDPPTLKAAEYTAQSAPNATPVPAPPRPRRTAISLPLAASQMRAVLSHDAVTIRDPSKLKAAEYTPLSWPPRARRQFACETAAASAVAAGEALVLSAGHGRVQPGTRRANLRGLAKLPTG